MSEDKSNSGGAPQLINSFMKGMNKDNSDVFVPESVWINAINAITNSHNGEMGSIGNEQSNLYCETFPYQVIGILNKYKTEWVVFSTDNTSSEIGLFDESTCSYISLVNDPCLNFSTFNLITGAVKMNYDCTYSAYWQDNLNPDRTMNLDPTRIPYICYPSSDPEACGVEVCTTDLDCDKLRLHPLVKQPCVKVSKSTGSGQLNNGTYQAVIAYSENGIKLTDYSMPSNPQGLWDHSGIGGSLDITLSNLDQNFEEFQLVVIGTVNQQTTAKIIGYYSINQEQIHLDLINASLITADLSVIPLKTVVYEKSEKLFDIGGYLLRSGVTSQPFFNYQPLANTIKVNWVAVQYPSDYYWNGGNEVGYMRDEVYSFFIRWVYKTGARSASFHIPGRVSRTADMTDIDVRANDILESTRNKCWEVYDTSTLTSTSNIRRFDGGIIIAKGDMAYWESSESYPNSKPEVWGDLCNKPIRHHKMPSNETTHIHNTTGEFINILGVEFTNISHPLDNNNLPITDIIGYEILRGSREGNRSILAKGIFNNMVEYPLDGVKSKKGLYQNYPYNDVSNDPFMETPDSLVYKKDIFSFHAPENNLVKPYIGNGGYVRIYTEEIGESITTPELAYMHPKFKFIHEDAFASIVVVAAGYALLELLGSTDSVTGTNSHVALPGGETEAWAALQGVGAVSIIKEPHLSFDSNITTSKKSGTASVYGDFLTYGVNSVATSVSGSVGGVATGVTIATTIAAVATAMFTGVMTFNKAFDIWLKILYDIISYKDYVIQLNSHSFYASHNQIQNINVPFGIQPSFNRTIKSNAAKYIGSGLQDFSTSYKVNNVNRTKFLALQLDNELPYTLNNDESRNLIPDTNNAFKTFKESGTRNGLTASYYGAIKFDYQNQYGQLHAITQIPVNSCVYDVTDNISLKHNSSQIFGGDVYINRYTEKNPYYFYNTWLTDVTNGTTWNYQNYINGPQPKYWLNSELYDASKFNISLSFSDIIPTFNFNTPADYYNLHGKKATGEAPKTSFKNAWMYLFNNGVRDFFTESELNLAFRDYGENSWEKFYDPVGDSFTDISLMFRADLITKPTYYEYDLSLSASKLYSNFSSWSNILPRDYDPAIYTTCFEYYPRRVIYSLQQQEGLKRDNWRNYLQFNYRDFEGKVNTFKSLNAQGSLILFEDAEPMQFVGVDTFQSTAGVKYTTGDAGLFQQNMQSIVNADDSFQYGTSISSKSVINTPYGLFWVSQNTGKIFNYAGSGIIDISIGGMKYWFLQNIPSPLLQVYPDFPLYDNVVEGISIQTVFDSQYELIYFTKKDYSPKPEFASIKDCLVYVPGKGFFINASTCPGFNTGTTQVKTCKTGYTYNSQTDLCEKVTSTNICPTGYTYQNGLCVIVNEYRAVCCDTVAPTVNTRQTFCGAKTVADLVATGIDIKWYNVAIGGIPLLTNAALSTGNYYVSQTISGCEGPRVLVNVICSTLIWAEKNLNVDRFYGSTYSDIGTGINSYWNSRVNQAMRAYPNGASPNAAEFGQLYNWYSLMGIWNTASRNDPLLRKTIVPPGWRIPTVTEWNDYVACACGGINFASPDRFREPGDLYWNLPNFTSGSVGFNARGAGLRNDWALDPNPVDSSYGVFKEQMRLWLLTPDESQGAFATIDKGDEILGYASTFSNGDGQSNGGYSRTMGYSIRLVKDI